MASLNIKAADRLVKVFHLAAIGASFVRAPIDESLPIRQYVLVVRPALIPPANQNAGGRRPLWSPNNEHENGAAGDGLQVQGTS